MAHKFNYFDYVFGEDCDYSEEMSEIFCSDVEDTYIESDDDEVVFDSDERVGKYLLYKQYTYPTVVGDVPETKSKLVTLNELPYDEEEKAVSTEKDNDVSTVCSKSSWDVIPECKTFDIRRSIRKSRTGPKRKRLPLCRMTRVAPFGDDNTNRVGGLSFEYPSLKPSNKKTRMCRFGERCFRKGTCNYAHSPQELKKRPCRFGPECRRKATCSFGHDCTVVFAY
jgi:hypothetical protein